MAKSGQLAEMTASAPRPRRGAQKTVCVTLLNAHCWSWRLGNDSRCSSEVATVRNYRVPRVKEGRESGQLFYVKEQ